MRLFLALSIALASVFTAAAQTDTLNAGNDTSICPGISFTLNATPGFDTYSWSPADGLSNPNIPNPVVSVDTTTTYVLTANTGTTNLIYNGNFSLGNVGFTSGQAYSSFYSPCNYYVAPLWFGMAVYPMLDHTPTADNMYMSIDGCYASPTVIYETSLPVLSMTDYDFSFWASRADAVQPDFEIHFIGNVTGDIILATYAGIPYTGTWTWDEYSVPTWNSGANTNVTIRIVNLETNGYGNDFGLDDISFTGPGYTDTDTDTITITVLPGITVTDDMMICKGESTTLHASGGVSYMWSTGDTTESITVNPSVSSSYVVAGTTVLGCTHSQHVHVTVVPAPIGTITGEDSLCLGESTTLTAAGGIMYQWNTTATSASITLTPASSEVYSVIVTNPNNCKDTVYYPVQVAPLPIPPTISGDTFACMGTVLPALVAIGQNIVWYTNAGSTTGATTAPFPNTDAAGIHTYYATQSENGCTSEKSHHTLTVMAIPEVIFPESLVICEGDTVTMGLPPSNDWTYTWMDGWNGSLRPIEQSGLYVLTASNQCGTSTDSCLVTKDFCDCYFYLPNAFTPNDDGLNEMYQPVYDCRIQNYVMRIYNRWGEIVFQSQDPNEGWDGNHHNQPVKTDVYVVKAVYTAKAGPNEITREYTGHVSLLR